MPRALRFEEEFDEWSLWLNELRDSELNPQRYGFALVNVDGLHFADRNPDLYFFVLEAKSRGAKLSKHQVIALELLRVGCVRLNYAPVGRLLRMWKGNLESRVVHFLGVHTLRMSGTTPDDSDTLLWDSLPITRGELVRILRFELSPNNFTELLTHEKTAA